MDDGPRRQYVFLRLVVLLLPLALVELTYATFNTRISLLVIGPVHHISRGVRAWVRCVATALPGLFAIAARAAALYFCGGRGGSAKRIGKGEEMKNERRRGERQTATTHFDKCSILARECIAPPAAFALAALALTFTHLHSHSAWCCNSPEAQNWKCETFHRIAALLDTHAIRWRPAWGTAIGMYRRGESIPWETDIDMCVHPDDCLAAHKLLGLATTRCEHSDWKQSQGYGANIYAKAWGGPGVASDGSWHGNTLSEVHLDMYICFEDKEDWHTPEEEVSVCGRSYSVHNATRSQLTRWYGAEWVHEPIVPYPKEGDLPVFFPRIDPSGVKAFKVPGCSLMLDRGLFFPESTCEWYLWRIGQAGLLAICWMLVRGFVLQGFDEGGHGGGGGGVKKKNKDMLKLVEMVPEGVELSRRRFGKDTSV